MSIRKIDSNKNKITRFI